MNLANANFQHQFDITSVPSNLPLGRLFLTETIAEFQQAELKLLGENIYTS